MFNYYQFILNSVPFCWKELFKREPSEWTLDWCLEDSLRLKQESVLLVTLLGVSEAFLS